MIIINDTPPAAGADLTSLYRRFPVEGMVHSTILQRERYDQASEYNENWRCPAITWSAGGEEIYQFDRRKPITIRPAGALMLAPGARYGYEARGDQAFVSNMIVFPRWITDGAAHSVLDKKRNERCVFSTQLLRPPNSAERLMDDVVLQCRFGEIDHNWFGEKIALLYELLLNEQGRKAGASQRIEAAKPATRSELSRRIIRAQNFVLESYADASLDLNTIAKVACLSQFHLIRVFKMFARVTPMQFLTAVRMEAALRLLRERKIIVSQTAAAVGYNSRVAFSRAFRKHHGFAPSAACSQSFH